ncbi:MAG: hypothetical protein SNJ58_15365 [Aggregatilineales bacterium]
MSKYIRFLLAAMLVLVSLSVVPTAYADTIVVSPGNLQGWLIGTPANSTPPEFAEFVEGPGAPPLGAGSYRVKVKTGQKITLGRTDYNGVSLSSLRISYSTYPPDAVGNDWYVNIYIDVTGDEVADCRLDYAPYVSTPPSSWIKYNPTRASASWFSYNAGGGTCPTTFSYPAYSSGVSFKDILAAYPSAVLKPDYPSNPVIVFNMGDFLNYDGAIDAITINDTSWDFEPAADVSNARPIVVHPGNLQNWLIEAPTALPPAFAEFVDGPSTPLLGTGSYRVTLAEPDTKLIMGRKDYNDTPLNKLEISYSTYRLGSVTNDWYVNVYINTTGKPDLPDCRLDFAPSAGSVGSWITHNAMSASDGWYSYDGPGGRCPAYLMNVPFATVIAKFPSAVLRAPSDQDSPAIVFNIGSFAGYDGAIDAITINGTTWDFELTAPDPSNLGN